LRSPTTASGAPRRSELFALATVAVFSHLLSACDPGAENDAPGASPDASNGSGAPVSSADVTPARWDTLPGERWRLEEDLRIGVVQGSSTADPRVFGRIRNVIPTDDGGVWVYDQQAVELRKFDASGGHLLSVGRAGQGPGEFSGNACARRGVGAEMWVETETNWHRFDPRGQLLGTFPAPGRLACGVRMWLDSTRYLVAEVETDFESRTQRSYFTIHEWSGDRFSVVDTVSPPQTPPPRIVTFTSRGGRNVSQRAIPFVHNADWRLQAGGRFLVWEGGGTYEIHLVGLEGDTIRSISRTYRPVSIDRRTRREEIDKVSRPGWIAEDTFSEADVPHTYPPFSSASLREDGTIWVNRVGDEGVAVREVFSASGEYLGELMIPEALEGLSITSASSDHVWGTVRDDLGVQFVVRARLIKGDPPRGIPD